MTANNSMVAKQTAATDGIQQTAVLTGASGGIGVIVARLLLDGGYRVVALSRSVPAIEHPAFTHIAFDAADLDGLEQICAHLSRQCPSVHVLIHCSAVIAPSSVEELNVQEALRQIAVNLTAPIVLTSRFLPNIQRGGRIVFVNSMAAAMPLSGSSVYAATKAGLRNMALSLAQEVRSRDISVSSIFPCAVMTNMLRQEMAEGGSILNFVSPPATPEAVAREIMALVRKPKLERFFPAMDGAFGRLCMFAPGLLRLSLPILTFFGKRGYRRALRRNLMSE